MDPRLCGDGALGYTKHCCYKVAYLSYVPLESLTFGKKWFLFNKNEG